MYLPPPAHSPCSLGRMSDAQVSLSPPSLPTSMLVRPVKKEEGGIMQGRRAGNFLILKPSCLAFPKIPLFSSLGLFESFLSKAIAVSAKCNFTPFSSPLPFLSCPNGYLNRRQGGGGPTERERERESQLGLTWTWSATHLKQASRERE